MEILILAISLAFVSTGVQSSCSQYDVGECMKPITDLRTKLGISDKIAYFPIYSLNDEQLDEYCSAGRQVTSCLDGLNACDNVVRRTFEGLQNSIVYLCTDTLQEYKTHQKCYAEKAVINGLQRCNSEAEKSFSHLDVTAYGAKDTFCGYVKDDYSCIKNTVQPECGKEAADWEVTYAKKTIQPLLDLINCNAVPKWLIGAIVAGIITLLVCVAVVIKVIISRKRTAGNPASHHFNNVLANRKI